MPSTHSLDYRSQAIPSTFQVTLTDAAKTYQMTLPRECRGVLLTPISKAIRVAYTGGDGTDMGTAGHPLSADGFSQVPLFPARESLACPAIFLQAADAGVVVTVSLLARTGIYGE